MFRSIIDSLVLSVEIKYKAKSLALILGELICFFGRAVIVELLLSHKLDEFRTIFVSELSDDALEDQSFEDDVIGSGLFLYLVDENPAGAGLTVLAKIPSHDLAFEFFDLFFPVIKRNQFSDKLTASP